MGALNEETIRLCLFVAGQSPNSNAALANLNAFCQLHLPHRHHLEVVDVLRQPDAALQEGIMLTPTLVVRSFVPPLRLVGDLSRPEALRALLG